MVLYSLSQRPLLLPQVGRNCIIDIGEQLAQWGLWRPSCNLNGLQELHTSDISRGAEESTRETKSRMLQCGDTSFLTLFLNSDSAASLHQPFLSTHFRYLETGSLAVLQCSISSTDLYFVESSDVE